MKRLLITSTDLMMVQFLVPHVIHLSQHGFEIDLACSEVGDRFKEVKDKLQPYCAAIHRVSLQRSPLSKDNIKGYRELKNIISEKANEGGFDIIWTNEPVMGVATRLAAKKARKLGTKVLYMAHGFHFFNGAPKINWLLFYPIEKMMAHHADVICTVNREDYKRARTFNVKKVAYIHGIGINTARLTPGAETHDIRKELNLPKEAFIVLSVGELNNNKNQATIIKAIGQLLNAKDHKNYQDLHYLLCGKGYNDEKLKALAMQLGIENHVHFLGYRRDVVDICSQSDIYAMPSFREGLPVSSLEAMYCGLPLVTSNIRGLTDVNKDNINGLLCNPDDISGFASNIATLHDKHEICRRMGERNKEDVIPYTIDHTLAEVQDLLNHV